MTDNECMLGDLLKAAVVALGGRFEATTADLARQSSAHRLELTSYVVDCNRPETTIVVQCWPTCNTSLVSTVAPCTVPSGAPTKSTQDGVTMSPKQRAQSLEKKEKTLADLYTKRDKLDGDIRAITKDLAALAREGCCPAPEANGHAKKPTEPVGA